MKLEKYLLRLYPQIWRSRYEEEFLAMLEQRPISWLDGLDLFFGALDAHLHPQLGTTGMSLYERMIRMISTLRHSLLTIFCAFIGFAVAGTAFQKMTEYDDFVEVARTHSVIGTSFTLVVIGSAVALLAILAGGLPVTFAVVKNVLAHKRRGPLLLLAVPVLVIALFFVVLFLLEKIPATNHPSRGVFLVAFFATIIVSTGALCLAVVRSEISEKMLRFALLPSLLTTGAMALMLVATITWGLGLRASDPQLFASNEGIMASSTTGTWIGIVVAMALATVLAAAALLRGISARSALRAVSA